MTFKQYKTQILKDPRSKKLNFNKVDDRYYVYRIIENKNEYYYGSRVSTDVPTIDLPKYGSTSKRKELIIENQNNIYTFKIVKVFDNNGDKILYEAYLHQYFNVKLHPKFWNEANQTPFNFDRTGVSNSKSHCENIKKAKQTTSDETRRRMSEGVKKRPQIKDETRIKMSLKGKSRAGTAPMKRFVESAKGKVYVTNQVDEIRVDRDNINQYINRGWVEGRLKVKCPHCDKQGDVSNMKRWHFNNCKLIHLKGC